MNWRRIRGGSDGRSTIPPSCSASAGRLEEAGARVRRACDILGRIRDRTGLSMSLKVRGQIATEQGAYDDAESALLEAHGAIKGRNQAMIEVDVVLRLAQLAYARGDYAGLEPRRRPRAAAAPISSGRSH